MFKFSPNLLAQFQTYTHTGILQFKFQFVQPDSAFDMS
jgi:hypothetical protein